MALYLGTDEPVRTTEWREGESVLVVQALTEQEEPARQQFAKPCVVYLGAHTGCSCGFAYGLLEPSSPEDEQRERLGRSSVEALRLFLERHVANGRDVELFSCWEGDQGSPAVDRLDVTPDQFGGDAFDLPEKVFYRVRGAA